MLRGGHPHCCGAGYKAAFKSYNPKFDFFVCKLLFRSTELIQKLPIELVAFLTHFFKPMNDEPIFYQPNETLDPIAVKIDEETVWLTQQQMATLFNQTKQNVSLHILNCFKENELDPNSVVKDSLTTAKDGKRYPTKFYNLDVVISVGYRVKSIEGTRFRIWAIRVLKDYLLKGIAINTRLDRLEDRMEAMGLQVNHVELQLNSHQIPTQGVFLKAKFLMRMS